VKESRTYLHLCPKLQDKILIDFPNAIANCLAARNIVLLEFFLEEEEKLLEMSRFNNIQ
jgi:hypothetical protein